ncbi:hypothetical protein EI427_11140 [Flammeovirga pectinis]|uniref:DUF4163 domain-containing protein n=1 Tax=Flammeovirga pectinis TaxID=2494373 RepID=A0A3Q9FM01_9BACT|nr:hypothetical protein [Flammeovirga pectinis]AZQ62767.1 hypothetical protein EI427_11140 [Flammeovirga pectinis]
MRLIIFSILLIFNTSFKQTSTVLNYALLENSIEIEKQGFNKLNSSLHYELNVSYPKVMYTNKIDVEHKINLDIQGIMAFAISDFLSKTREVKIDKGVLGLSYMNLNYNVHFNQNGILSLCFDKETFYNGLDGIRKLSVTYNYDVNDKRKIQLKDLFVKDVDYYSKLNKIIKEKLGSGAKVSSDAVNTFCITKEGLYFPLDVKKCRGKKCPDFIKINWSELQGILSPYISQKKDI